MICNRWVVFFVYYGFLHLNLLPW